MTGAEDAAAFRSALELDFDAVDAAEGDAVNDRVFEGIRSALAFRHKKLDPGEQLANIRSRFPTASAFLEASPYMLRRSGIDNIDAFYFTMLPAIARRAAREALGPKPKLDTLSVMADYLKDLFIGVHVECFYLVMLTASGLLIDARKVQQGTVDSTPFYLRETMAIAVLREAKAVVLCHNHPAGTLRPSKEDLICTLNVLNCVSPLGIPMLDHIIIARDRAVSIRDSGLLPAELWTMQAPGNRLVKNWVDVDLLKDLPDSYGH